MLTTFVIGLREGLEASLIVGIVAAFLRRNGGADAGRALRRMWIGVGAAVAICLAGGITLSLVNAHLPQRQQEMLECVVAVVAVVMVTYMILWMNSHSRGLKGELESAAAGALARGSALALSRWPSSPCSARASRRRCSCWPPSAPRCHRCPRRPASSSDSPSPSCSATSSTAAAPGSTCPASSGVTGIVLVLVAGGLVMSALQAAHEAAWLTVGQQPVVDLSWLVRPGFGAGVAARRGAGHPAAAGRRPGRGLAALRRSRCCWSSSGRGAAGSAGPAAARLLLGAGCGPRRRRGGPGRAGAGRPVRGLGRRTSASPAPGAGRGADAGRAYTGVTTGAPCDASPAAASRPPSPRPPTGDPTRRSPSAATSRSRWPAPRGRRRHRQPLRVGVVSTAAHRLPPCRRPCPARHRRAHRRPPARRAHRCRPRRRPAGDLVRLVARHGQSRSPRPGCCSTHRPTSCVPCRWSIPPGVPVSVGVVADVTTAATAAVSAERFAAAADGDRARAARRGLEEGRAGASRRGRPRPPRLRGPAADPPTGRAPGCATGPATRTRQHPLTLVLPPCHQQKEHTPMSAVPSSRTRSPRLRTLTAAAPGRPRAGRLRVHRPPVPPQHHPPARRSADVHRVAGGRRSGGDRRRR